LRTPGRATFDGPARAVACAQELIAEFAARGHHVGAAVHSGECLLADGDVQGVAVEIACRLAADADPGEVLVSQTVRDLVVGSNIGLEPRDRRAFDGVPGKWDVFAIVPPER
jgi:class 3 adenylate cyclase